MIDFPFELVELFGLDFLAPQESPPSYFHSKYLENGLTVTLALLQILLDRLEAKFGPDFLGSDLQGLKGKLEESRSMVTQIEELLQQGKQPAAVRLYREFAGVTWDEAHVMIGQWKSFPLEQKTHWLHLTRLARALGSHLKKGSSKTNEKGT